MKMTSPKRTPIMRLQTSVIFLLSSGDRNEGTCYWKIVGGFDFPLVKIGTFVSIHMNIF